jgi:hypothetical protein
MLADGLDGLTSVTQSPVMLLVVKQAAEGFHAAAVNGAHEVVDDASVSELGELDVGLLDDSGVWVGEEPLEPQAAKIATDTK